MRAAQHELPAALVAALDTQLRAHARRDRIDEVIDELERVRVEAGSPPLAAPIGQILASQALLHVLSASRYATVVDELRALVNGRFGTPPGPIDPTVHRAVELGSPASRTRSLPADLDGCATGGGPRGERGGAAAARALRRRGRAAAADDPRPRRRRRHARGGGVDQTRAERIREIVRIVQETGVDEITSRRTACA